MDKVEFTKKEEELIKLAELGGGNKELFLLDRVNEVDDKMEVFSGELKKEINDIKESMLELTQAIKDIPH